MRLTDIKHPFKGEKSLKLLQIKMFIFLFFKSHPKCIQAKGKISAGCTIALSEHGICKCGVHMLAPQHWMVSYYNK